MGRKRLFVGLPVPGPVRRSIEGMVGRLRPNCPGVRWSSPDGLHITLAYLGVVEESRIDRIVEAMARSVDGLESFDVAAAGVRAFPDDEMPEVIWVGLGDGEAALAALQRPVAAAFVDLGFEFEDRPFVPHITIGRVSRKEPRAMVAQGIRGLRERDLGILAVTEVALYVSEPSAGGSRYRIMATALLD